MPDRVGIVICSDTGVSTIISKKNEPMCGIAGFLDSRKELGAQELSSMASKMAESIYYRGPDAAGVWVDSEVGIAFGHRRLSIIDLSEAGAQPMLSSCGRFVICYNGEVYNHRELKKELEAKGRRFIGHSDTEVIVEGCSEWGIRDTVTRLIGMFSFSLWDRSERCLILVRDRIGIKPVYWGQFGKLLIFGSELKALCAHPGWHPELDRDALAAYMRHNYVPCPYAIYKGIKKLEPGTMLRYNGRTEPTVERYWDLSHVVKAGQEARESRSDSETVELVEQLLEDSVRRRMIADVPLGAFLSGGVDSSTVVALMQANSSRPVRTFSIGFDEKGYDEAPYAARVASYLGTDHTELYATSRHAYEVIPKLPEIYDEPFSDSSQIPTYLLSALTREHVTVCLSGDGGDELFAGYNRYHQAQAFVRSLGYIPLGLRKVLANLVRWVSPDKWSQLFSILPSRIRLPQAGDKIHKLASVLTEEGDAFYRRLISHWDQPESTVLGAREPKGIVWDPSVKNIVADFTERMQYLDTLTYLPDDILTKVDRASMAVSLEARVPILDHRVVEMSWMLPRNAKIRGRESKWVLRRILDRYVPKTLIERPKMGFGVPIDTWLRRSLRDWAEDLLHEKEMLEDGILNAAEVRKKWSEHLSEDRNWQYHLWDVLMFQSWKSRWL